jgi:hypothetical protein
MELYLVEASKSNYDEFQKGVVYAENPDDAIAIVLDACARDDSYELPGAWYPIARNALLTATPVEHKRGVVLGHGAAG